MSSVKHDTYTKGEWVVHVRNGVGQVKGRDLKTLDGKKKVYLRIKTFESEYWLPVGNQDVAYIRPISSEKQLKNAFKVFRETAEILPKENKEREKRINEVLKCVCLFDKARMIRDLTAKNRNARLGYFEDSALQKMKRQFINEWAVVFEVDRDTVERELDSALLEGAESKTS